jgi:hypothetical protein
MNPPVKKGKYSMVADESIQSCSTQLQQKNLKQCEYVSNRTRLRCQNIRLVDELKDFGFCEEVHFIYFNLFLIFLFGVVFIPWKFLSIISIRVKYEFFYLFTYRK